MSEEIFDVVNDRDEVVGQNTRSEVHRLGLQHRAVHVLVFNSKGEVFLQKRSLKKDRQPGLWDSSASGHLDCGEEYDACAVREVAEEIGLRLAQCPARLFKIAASPETDQEHVWIYRCEAEGPFELNAEEIERGDWFAPEEVTRWTKERPQDFAGGFLAIWKRLVAEVSRRADRADPSPCPLPSEGRGWPKAG
jgi:isopentenyldiphosphate isomerase